MKFHALNRELARFLFAFEKREFFFFLFSSTMLALDSIVKRILSNLSWVMMMAAFKRGHVQFIHTTNRRTSESRDSFIFCRTASIVTASPASASSSPTARSATASGVASSVDITSSGCSRRGIDRGIPLPRRRLQKWSSSWVDPKWSDFARNSIRRIDVYPKKNSTTTMMTTTMKSDGISLLIHTVGETNKGCNVLFRFSARHVTFTQSGNFRFAHFERANLSVERTLSELLSGKSRLTMRNVRGRFSPLWLR